MRKVSARENGANAIGAAWGGRLTKWRGLVASIAPAGLVVGGLALALVAADAPAARAACTQAGNTITCTGTTTTSQSFNLNTAGSHIVTFDAGASIDVSGTGDALRLTATNVVNNVFIDARNAGIIDDGGNHYGIYLKNFNNDGDITILASAPVSGGFEGIKIENKNTGSVALVTGDVSSTVTDDAIDVENRGSNTGDVIIQVGEVGAPASAVAKADAIEVDNYGTGKISVTVHGNLKAGTGNNHYGIEIGHAAGGIGPAGNSVNTKEISVNVTGNIEAGGRGISIKTKGVGRVVIDAQGNITGIGGPGNKMSGRAIHVETTGANSGTVGNGVYGVYVTTASGKRLETQGKGIYVSHAGKNGVVVNSYADIIADNGGIDVSLTQAGVAGELFIDSRGTITVANNQDGIHAVTKNDGEAVIVAKGDITAGENAIDADHQGNNDLRISVDANLKGGSGYAIKTATKIGRNTELTIHSGTVESTSGKAILNNEGDSTITVKSAAVVKGDIKLGNGSDLLTFEGADISNVTLFDGGDDRDSGDGWVDVLTFKGIVNNNLSASKIRNWERFELAGNSNVKFTGNTLDVGLLVVAAGSRADFSGLSMTLKGGLRNNGVVTTQNGAAGDELVVDGDYEGNGQVLIDTQLGDSSSPTDKVTIKGDNHGQIALVVNNAGGAGAYTGNGPTDGIRVVEIQGANNGSLTLANGPLMAGAYVYSITDNGYLQSRPLSSGMVAAVAPALLSTTMESLWERTSSTWATVGERTTRVAGFTVTPTAATPLDLVSGFWTRGRFRNMKADADVTVAGVPFGAQVKRNRLWLQLGYTHELMSDASGRLAGSIYGQYIHSSLKMRNAGGASSRLKGDGFGGGISLTWLGASGLYADALGEIVRHRLTFTDAATGAQARVWGTMWRASVEAGYRLPMADNVNLIPQAQLHVGKGSVKDFTIGGLSYSVHAKAIATGRIGMGVEFANVEVGDMLVTAQTTVSLLRDLNKGGYATVGGQRVESSLARTRLQLHSIVHMHLPDSAATLFFQSSFSHSLKGPKRREMLVSGGVKIAF